MILFGAIHHRLLVKPHPGQYCWCGFLLSSAGLLHLFLILWSIYRISIFLVVAWWLYSFEYDFLISRLNFVNFQITKYSTWRLITTHFLPIEPLLYYKRMISWRSIDITIPWRSMDITIFLLKHSSIILPSQINLIWGRNKSRHTAHPGRKQCLLLVVQSIAPWLIPHYKLNRKFEILLMLQRGGQGEAGRSDVSSFQRKIRGRVQQAAVQDFSESFSETILIG